MIEYSEKIPDYADVLTVGEYRDACKSHSFIDYDGHGHPIKDGMMAGEVLLKPSKVRELPQDCTHVAWFNR